MVGQVGSSLVAAVVVERAKPAVVAAVVVERAKLAAVAAAVVGLAKPVAVAAAAAVAALQAEDFEFLLEQV